VSDHLELQSYDGIGVHPQKRLRAPGRLRRSLVTICLLVLAACFLDELSGPRSNCANLSFAIVPDSTMVLNGTHRFSVSLSACSGDPTTVIWASRDSTIVSIDRAGLASAHKIDSVRITARLIAPDLDTGRTASRLVRVLVGSPAQLAKIAGDTQAAIVGTALKIPPTVRVEDSLGNPVQSALVVFSTVDTSVNGWVRDSFGARLKAIDTVRTNATGIAAVGGWVLGATRRTNLLTAQIGTIDSSFTATATTPSLDTSIRLGNSQLVVGGPIAVAPKQDVIFVGGYRSGYGTVSTISASADTALKLDSIPLSVIWMAANPVTGGTYVAGSTGAGYALCVYALGGPQLCTPATAPLPGYPGGIAYLPSKDQVWVTVPDSQSVAVFAGTTLTRLPTQIAVPDPRSIAVDSTAGVMYIASGYPSPRVTAVNATTFAADSIFAPVDGNYIAANSATHRVYASTATGVIVLDGLSDTILGTITISLPPSAGISGISVSEKFDHTYVATNSGIVVINADTVSQRLLGGESLGGIGINPMTDKVYATVLSPVSGVTALSDLSMKVVNNIARTDRPRGVAVDQKRNLVYVANSATDNVSVIDGKTNQTVGLPFSVGPSPYGVAVDTGLNRVFVAINGGREVDAIDINSGRVEPIYLLDSGPREIVVDQSTHTVYAANGDHLLSVIDGFAKREVLPPFQLDGYPNGIALDESRRLISLSIGKYEVRDTNNMIRGFSDCECYGDVVVNPLNRRAYVSDVNGAVWVFDDSTAKLVKLVITSEAAAALGIDPSANVVFAPTSLGIDVLSGDLDNRIHTIPGGVATPSSGVAVNAKTGRVYLVDSNVIVVIRDN
jgi:DNA-binding beta-propeller fold protein YncE